MTNTPIQTPAAAKLPRRGKKVRQPRQQPAQPTPAPTPKTTPKAAAPTPSPGPTAAQLAAAQQLAAARALAGQRAEYEASRPGYSSKYQHEIDDLLEDILDREDFSYDFSADPMYGMYRDQYVQGGQQAMADTTAQAAALTGGYANSYAASAGSQAYQQYLTRLNSVIPELYDAALQRYNSKGTALQNRLTALQNAESSAYSRYRDELEDWENEYKRRFG